MEGHSQHVAFIWSVADLLRGDYKQSEYGKVILPFTVLRRLDCVLEPTKAAVLASAAELDARARQNLEPFLRRGPGCASTTPSQLDFADARWATRTTSARTCAPTSPAFSPERARDLRAVRVPRADRPAGQGRTCSTRSSASSPTSTCTPTWSATTQMGYVFEELIRRFAELSNETAGEHFTPREVIRLMVNLLFTEDEDALTDARRSSGPSTTRPAAPAACSPWPRSTSARAQPRRHARDLRPGAQRRVLRHLQVRHADQGPGRRATSSFGNTLQPTTATPASSFDYMLANPPFGVEWKKIETAVKDEHETLGLRRPLRRRPAAHQRRLAAVPAAHDLEDEAAREDGGSRIAIVFNGSPLFTGGAGSGRVEIRRWIIENDWLEASSRCPTSCSTTPASSTYIWIVTNPKKPEREGKVQLIDAREQCGEDAQVARQQAQAAPRRGIAEITRCTRTSPRPRRARSSTTRLRLPARHGRAAAAAAAWTCRRWRAARRAATASSARTSSRR